MAKKTPPDKGENPFRTVIEAAAFLRLTRGALDRYRWLGGGPRYRKHGGRIFYHIDDLVAWSESRQYQDSATRSQ
jgi:hypothetical protein